MYNVWSVIDITHFVYSVTNKLFLISGALGPFLRAVPHLVGRHTVEPCSIYSARVYSDTALQYDR